MSPRARFGAFVALVMLVACARGGGTPAPAGPPVPAPGDSTLARQREDSIRETVTAPAAPPVAAAPDVPAQPGTPAAPEPEKRCILDLTNREDTRVQRIQDPTTKKYFTYIGGGVFGRCRDQEITIEADSAESYEVNNLHILIGRVKYHEPRYSIEADRATYFRAEERILFQGNVRTQMQEQDARMVGQQLEYFRPAEGIRTRARIVATQRPQLTYVEVDSVTREQRPPMHVWANVITGEGDSTFHASGQVRLERTDVIATSDSATLYANGQYARLMKEPLIESTGEQAFTLRGREIMMFGTGRAVERVLAVDSGRAVSAQFTLTADTIDLRVIASQLQRAFAFGNTGAYAITPGRDILADSLDIVMPQQRIRELRAIGKAYAESDPDTVRIESDERDWIRGDTLIARFDSVANTDSSPPRLRDLFASGDASAYYQIPADSTSRSRPGINYITGRVIRLVFDSIAVQSVTVTDQVSGVYLAPLPADSVAPPAGTPPRRPPARQAPGRGIRPR